MRKFLLSSITPLDFFSWVAATVFFSVSAIIYGGNLLNSFIGVAAIVLLMVSIGFSVDVIIETLRNVRGLGTITGFITNGPEAICLIVGLAVGNALFAVSTPLGSNVMNPVLLILAALVCRALGMVLRTETRFVAATLITTVTLAVVGYIKISDGDYALWMVVTLIVSTILFARRPTEPESNEDDEPSVYTWWCAPSILVLIAAGYMLDPVVSHTAEASNTPKGIIGFVVLSFFTSWPEFKMMLSFLRGERPLEAIMNMSVSNITNLWLALAGLGIYIAL